jgi:hypothetical protein
MKRRHEQRATEPFVISDDTARRILTLMTGGVIGAVLSEVIPDVSGFAQALANALSPPTDPKAPIDDQGENLLRELEEVLRYGPKGQITFYSEDARRMRIGAFFAEIFRRAGWRVISPTAGQFPGAVSATRDEVGPALFFVFLLKDEHQVTNARQTVDQFFLRCGFRPVENPSEGKYRSGDDILLILAHIGIFH